MKGLFPNQVDRLAAERSWLLINDVPYMPVPRCESCTYWQQEDSTNVGDCIRQGSDATAKFWTLNFDAVTTQRDFGCVEWEAK